MNELLNFMADNRSIARVQGVGSNSVRITIDPSHHWDVDGLRKLSAALASVAAVLDSQ